MGKVWDSNFRYSKVDPFDYIGVRYEGFDGVLRGDEVYTSSHNLYLENDLDLDDVGKLLLDDGYIKLDK